MVQPPVQETGAQETGIQEAVSDVGDRRAARHQARQREFCAAATALVEADGLDALTMKALADRLDCAVGAVYSYFPSKDALIVAVQADAIERLTVAYDATAAALAPAVETLDTPVKHLARLVAFGRTMLVAEQVMAEEFHLQQRMLSTPTDLDQADAAAVVPVAFDLLARPQQLLDDAVVADELDSGSALDRTITWISALNGVLIIDAIQVPEMRIFDPRLLADQLSLDLLSAWGADPTRLERAAATISMRLVTECFRRGDAPAVAPAAPLDQEATS